MLFLVHEAAAPPMPIADHFIADHCWDALSEETSRIDSLLPFSAEILKDRYNRQEAAIVLFQNQIICHINCVKVFSNGNYLRGGRAFRTFPFLWNAPSVSLMLSGWTHPDFRRKGYNLLMKKKLIEYFSGLGHLVIGVSGKEHGIPMLKRLHCSLVNQGDIPFVQALSCLSSSMGIRITDELADSQCLWVSDRKLADSLDAEIAFKSGMSIENWRLALDIETDWGARSE